MDHIIGRVKVFIKAFGKRGRAYTAIVFRGYSRRCIAEQGHMKKCKSTLRHNAIE